MGLRKVAQGGTSFYLHTKHTEDHTLKIIISSSTSSYKLLLNSESDQVLKWSGNLQKSGSDYLLLFHQAIENPENEENQLKKEKDIFEIQDDSLLWKQFFPDKNIYGRRGKFQLEQISHEDAVNLVLDETISEVISKNNYIKKLTQEFAQLQREKEQFGQLARDSVLLKEKFEKEVYGKFITILNAKKEKIRQLMANKDINPDNINNTQEPRIDVKAKTVKQNTKRAFQELENETSDHYESDTDIDKTDEEIDTDEEIKVSISPCKAKKIMIKNEIMVNSDKFESTNNLQSTSHMVQNTMNKTLDDSLELELCPFPEKIRVATKNLPLIKKAEIKTGISKSDTVELMPWD